MTSIKLVGIPSTYQGWQAPVIMDGAGKVYVGQTGKVIGVSNWAFHVWVKPSIESAEATRVLSLPDGSNGSLTVMGGKLYAIELKRGGGIWLTEVPGYVPVAPSPGPTPPAPSDGVTISHDVAVALQGELNGQLPS